MIEETQQHWEIAHPGTGEKLRCTSFDEAMQQWFEGFNVPVLITNGIQEDFKTSYERVRDYYAGIQS